MKDQDGNLKMKACGLLETRREILTEATVCPLLSRTLGWRIEDSKGRREGTGGWMRIDSKPLADHRGLQCEIVAI